MYNCIGRLKNEYPDYINGMRSNLLILLILLSIKCVCQDARMVLDSVYLVFNPSPTTPTYLVIENPNPSAISILDTSLIKQRMK